MRRKQIILLVASTAIFFEALDIAILNLAIPLMQQQFRLDAETIQWVQTVYVLFYGGFLVIGGKLCDTVGRKISSWPVQDFFMYFTGRRTIG